MIPFISLHVFTYNNADILPIVMPYWLLYASTVDIYDMGSTDNTLTIIKDFPDIKIHCISSNRYDVSYINKLKRSIENSTNTFVCDADEIICPDEQLSKLYNIIINGNECNVHSDYYEVISYNAQYSEHTLFHLNENVNIVKSHKVPQYILNFGNDANNNIKLNILHFRMFSLDYMKKRSILQKTRIKPEDILELKYGFDEATTTYIYNRYKIKIYNNDDIYRPSSVLIDNTKKDCVILIEINDFKLKSYQEYSIKQTLKILSLTYVIGIISSFSNDERQLFNNKFNYEFIYVNKLANKTYILKNTFKNYNYILILNTECYVNYDNLPKYMTIGYEYISRPDTDISTRPVLIRNKKSKILTSASPTVSALFSIGSNPLYWYNIIDLKLPMIIFNFIDKFWEDKINYTYTADEDNKNTQQTGAYTYKGVKLPQLKHHEPYNIYPLSFNNNTQTQPALQLIPDLPAQMDNNQYVKPSVLTYGKQSLSVNTNMVLTHPQVEADDYVFEGNANTGEDISLNELSQTYISSVLTYGKQTLAANTNRVQIHPQGEADDYVFEGINGLQTIFADNGVFNQRYIADFEVKRSYTDIVCVHEDNSDKLTTVYEKGVSICISAYKAENFIEETLDSIVNLDYFKNHDNWECLICVDGCKNTYNKILEIKHKYDPTHFKFYMSDQNMGTYILSNTLMGKIAKYSVLFRFDADDLMRNDYVSKHLSQINRGYDISYVFCMDFYDNSFTGRKRKINTYSMHAVGLICVKKDVFIAIGGYMPWKCAADSEFYRRSEHLYKISIINNYYFDRRIHSNNLTVNKQTNMQSAYRRVYSEYIQYVSKNIRTYEQASIKMITATIHSI